jgi:hypothetical protein
MPIILDGVNSTYRAPHTFAMLSGFHNFSLSNEFAGGQFIESPPTLEALPTDAEFSVLARGVNWIIIGSPISAPNSVAMLNFTYGSTPVVEISRDSFVPGTTATFGLKVHMNPLRTASGTLDIYDPNRVADIPSYTKNFTIVGTQTTAVQYPIPRDAHTGTWSYKATIEDTDMHVVVSGTFDVSFLSTPTPMTYPAAQPIPYTTFDVAGTSYALFGPSHASAVVFYVGGGTIGNIAGPTPINGDADVTNENSGPYRLVYDLVAQGFSVVTPASHWQGLNFPIQVINYLHQAGSNTIYGIGYSAGGVVIASNLINNPSLFSKAIIIDSPLTEEASGFYFTDLSIQAGAVKVPNLLVWGREDNQVRLSNAYAWIDHVGSEFTTLAIYDYQHDWTGTSAETQVRDRIVSFLSGSSSTEITPRLFSNNLISDSLHGTLDNKLFAMSLTYYSITLVLSALAFSVLNSRLFFGSRWNIRE